MGSMLCEWMSLEGAHLETADSCISATHSVQMRHYCQHEICLKLVNPTTTPADLFYSTFK